jgi:drug/metabolite transporter (DMT)-like permease
VVDAWLVLMVVIWGVNYSVIKSCFADIPPQPFNALRLIIASAVFLTAIRIARRRARAEPRAVSRTFYTPYQLTTRDRVDLLWLGIVGHLAYQFFFVGGVAVTSVSNAALIIGATPVVITIVSAALGRDRVSLLHWIGAAISGLGIYFVVGHGASFGGATLKGDVLVMISVVCWAAYTLGAGRLMARHSPLYVTGITMVTGGIPYVLLALPQMLHVDWSRVHVWTWIALVLSALLALCLAYTIWYAAVQRIGPARTSIYSNVVPLVAMGAAAIILHEPLSGVKMAGAAAVLTGVFLTRLAKSPVSQS